MEVEFSGDRRRRRLLLLSGGALALVTAGVIVFVLQQPPPPPAPVATRTVIVAAVAIPARTVIGASMLTTADLSASSVLDDVLTDPSDAVGKVTTVGILKNQLISPNLYGGGNLGGLAILAADETISPDSPVWRAISVLVPKERAVGGMLVPGEHVDLFTTIKLAVYDPSGAQTDGALPSSGYYSENTTKLTWSDVEILAYNLEEDLYVLKVDEHQAEEIAHIQGSDLNGFSLSLRPEADTRDIDRSGYGETTNRILEQYDFPVPQVIDLNGYPQPAAQPSPFSNVPWGASPTPVPSPAPSAVPSTSPKP
jgi:Flp pilus assembly protein CpaB